MTHKEDAMADKDFLSDFKFFAEVETDTLDAIGRKCEILNLNSEDTIFDYNEPSLKLFGLIGGEVELSLVFKDRVLKTEIEYEEAIQTRMVDEEKQIVVDTVQPGQVFGWSCMVGSGKRTVTAKCSEPSRVFAIPAADLRDMLEEDPALGYTIMKKLSDIISKRLQSRTDKLIETWIEAFDVGEI